METILRDFPVQEVWGIGSQWAKEISSYHIKTAWDLAAVDIKWARQAFNIILARTALELRGISCLNLEEISPPKKNMISSRSFGTPVLSFEVLRESVCSHTSSLAQKLRHERSKTSLISVSIRTNPFDKKGAFYTNTALIPLISPSQDTSILIKNATLALKQIFREGLSYKKAGVMVLNISSENQIQPSLFKEMGLEESPKRKALLQTIDNLNHQYGKDSLVFASEGVNKSWKPQSSWKSPSFTQNWNQLMKVE